MEVRERFAVGTAKLGEAASELRALTGVAEVVVVSTCNRTEFYLAATGARETLALLEIHLAEKTDLHGIATPHFYRMEKAAAQSR